MTLPTYGAIPRRLVVVVILCLLASPVHALTSVYEVQSGDSLWEIASRFGTSVSTIKQLNKLKSSSIHPGQRLLVGSSIRKIEANNGPYYYASPKSETQKSRGYAESSSRSAREDYNRANRLIQAHLAELRDRFGKAKKRESPLKGWRIMLDPGHGGRDPGAIVSNETGDKEEVHVVEDEYVYDITMRVMERLMLYGAEVQMTVLSPNHLKRDSFLAKETFVNEKNEVYNDEAYNRKADPMVRPGSHNIKRRVMVANRFFKKGRKDKSLFVSLHADNSPQRPKGPLVIYQKKGSRMDKPSRTFAKIMQSALNHRTVPSLIGSRNMAVLRDNRASAEILVEIRNVSSKDDAWALRFHEKRQEDADRIVRGVLDYATSR